MKLLNLWYLFSFLIFHGLASQEYPHGILQPVEHASRPHMQTTVSLLDNSAPASQKLSPGVMEFYAVLSFTPSLLESGHGLIRTKLLGDLSDEDFLAVYNNAAAIREWPEADQRILYMIRDNECERVSRLINVLDVEHFLRWYPQFAHHYEARNRVIECHRRLLQGDLDSRCRDDKAIYTHATMIKEAVKQEMQGPLTPIQKSYFDRFKESLGFQKDVPPALTSQAQCYIRNSFSQRDVDKFNVVFHTIEQRELQAKIVGSFNQLAELDRNAPQKKREVLKEAGTLGIIASECNHSGQVVLGTKALAVCQSLLDFTTGVAEGAWQGVVSFAEIVRHPIDTSKSLAKAAWEYKEFLLAAALLFTPAQPVVLLMGGLLAIQHKDILFFLGKELTKLSARESGKLVGELGSSFIVPELAFSQGARLMKGAYEAAKKLEVVRKVKQAAQAQERLIVAAKSMDTLQILASETANCMAAAQKNMGAIKSAPASYLELMGAAVMDPLVSMERLQRRLTNLLEICGNIEEIEQIMAELAELGRKFQNRIKCPSVTDQLIKLDLDHIFALDIKWAQSAVRDIAGFHSDTGGLIQQAGKVIFRGLEEGPMGLYRADLQLGKAIKRSTFFPRNWDRGMVLVKLQEALQFIINIMDGKANSKIIVGKTADGVVIDFVVEGLKRGSNALMNVKSAYPNIEMTRKFLNL